MTLTERKDAFVALGQFMGQFAQETPEKQSGILLNDMFFEGMQHQLKLAHEANSWFTKANLAFAFKSWAAALTLDSINNWLDRYNATDQCSDKQVAIVMAGNIPLVGFHDFLSVLISGHKVLVKNASKDKHLLPWLAKYVETVQPGFKGRITFTDEKPDGFDAIIATGSGNTARYFEYYFGNYPHIIRKNRNSVAVLTGNESEEQLMALGEDIFRYFGLGCRNVSKLFVPKGYDFDLLFKAVYDWGHLMDNKKYMNNYDYNKAVYMMSLFPITENGFLMLREETSYASPIATLFYEYYDDRSALKNQLQTEREKIQCVVADGFIDDEVPFGKTQSPELWDYADQVDTTEFLLKI